MKRVIQDSDDDDDEEFIEEDLGNVSKVQHANVNASVTQETAGSTESLKQAIQVAHRDHFVSPVDQSVSTLQNAPNLLRTPSQNQVTDTSSPGPTPYWIPPTNAYGNAEHVLGNPFPGEFHDLPLPNGAGAMTNSWHLEGSMRQDYINHEPMLMFPEPSSTVPNATATQQRLIDDLMNPRFLDNGAEPDPLEPPEERPNPSIPWSEFINEDSTAQQDQYNENAHASSHHADTTHTHEQTSSHHSDTTHTHEQTSSRHEDTTSSQKRKSRTPHMSQRSRGSSVILPGSPLKNEVRPEDIEQPNPTPTPSKLTIMEDALENLPNGFHSIKNSVAMQPTLPQEGENQTESTQSKTNSRNKRKSNAAPISEDYLEDIGLPKEQYKPRPSRRSLNSLVEPVDYSIRPEKAARKGTRRCKTTGSIDTTATKATPQKIQQINEMGFTYSSATTSKALEKNNGDVNLAVGWLMDHGSAEDQDELAPSRAPKTKSKAPKSRKNMDNATQQTGLSNENMPPHKEDQIAPLSVTAESETNRIAGFEDSAHSAEPLHNTTYITGHPSPIKVSVVIHNGLKAESKPKEPVGDMDAPQIMEPENDNPARKAKRRKTTVDSPELVEEENTPEPPAEAVKEKKRGRGRAKKESVAALPAESTEAQRADASQQREDAEDQPKHEEFPVPAVAAPVLATEAAPVEPSKTAEKQTKTTIAQLSKGKTPTPYRVGLSKRARIAPLLKIVKK